MHVACHKQSFRRPQIAKNNLRCDVSRLHQFRLHRWDLPTRLGTSTCSVGCVGLGVFSPLPGWLLSIIKGKPNGLLTKMIVSFDMCHESLFVLLCVYTGTHTHTHACMFATVMILVIWLVFHQMRAWVHPLVCNCASIPSKALKLLLDVPPVLHIVLDCSRFSTP